MKYRILIFNDNTKRDLLGLKIIQKEFILAGCKAIICNPDTVKYKFRLLKPHAFIAARGDHWEAKEAAKACLVYIVPGEGAQQTKETILSVFMGRAYWKLTDVHWIKKCFLWNRDTRDWLLDTKLFKNHQLTVSGNTRLDIYRNQKVLRNLLIGKPKEFVLGVAFSSKSTSTYDGKLKYAENYFNMHRDLNFPITPPGRNFEDICWRDHIILRLSMRYIKRFLDTMNGKIILRPSPFEDPKTFRFLEKLYPGRISIESNQPLPEFCSQIDTLLTCWSTTGLEALIMNKPVISIAGTIDQEHLFRHVSARASGFEGYVKYFHYPKTEQELMSLVDLAAHKKLAPSPRTDLPELLEKMYNWPSESAASSIIVEKILCDLKTDCPATGWKSTFTYPIPDFMAPVFYTLRNYIRYIRSGFFNTYYGFRKVNDKKISKLVKQM
ncbi:MAG: hypothetical protein AB8G05_16755 [Oligoflexales bacterium]